MSLISTIAGISAAGGRRGAEDETETGVTPEAEAEATVPEAGDQGSTTAESAEAEASAPTEPAVDPSAAVAAAVSAERGRIKAILTAPEAEHAPDLAARLAFDTDRPAAEAIGDLKAAVGAVKPPANALDAWMEEEGNPDLGTGATDAGVTTDDDELVAFAKKHWGAQKPRAA